MVWILRTRIYHDQTGLKLLLTVILGLLFHTLLSDYYRICRLFECMCFMQGCNMERKKNENKLWRANISPWRWSHQCFSCTEFHHHLLASKLPGLFTRETPIWFPLFIQTTEYIQLVPISIHNFFSYRFYCDKYLICTTIYLCASGNLCALICSTCIRVLCTEIKRKLAMKIVPKCTCISSEINFRHSPKSGIDRSGTINRWNNNNPVAYSDSLVASREFHHNTSKNRIIIHWNVSIWDP